MSTDTSRDEEPLDAFIDPPGVFASLDEWLAFRASLNTLDCSGLGPIKRQADEMIARKRRGED